MSRRFEDLDVAASLGATNEFLVDQNGVPKRVTWGTIKTSAENAGSIAGAAAASVVAQAVVSTQASAIAQAVGSAAGSAAAQAVVGATSAALRDDITSIRLKHTSVANLTAGGVLTSANLATTSADIQGVINATSAALRDDITSIRTKHTSVTTYLTNLSAQQVDVPYLSGSTYTKVQDAMRLNHSSGVIVGGQIKDDGDGTFTVSAGIGVIRSEASIESEIYFFDWAQESGTNVSVASSVMNYFYVEYNGGTPRVYASIVESSDYFTKIFLGTALRYGTDAHITDNSKAIVGDHAIRMLRRMNAVQPFARESGGVLTETGTRNIAITAGTWWEGLNQFTTNAIDTSGVDTVQYYYRNGGTGWTEVLSQTQINNTQYDNNSGTLATLSNNKYGVHWVYMAADSDVYVLYGQGDYSLTEAQDASRPSDLPPHMKEDHARLIGKIIIGKGDSTFTAVESAFDTTFESSPPSDHNALQSLQGGTTGEYYHLTSAQYTEYTSITGVVSKHTNLLENAFLTSTDPTSSLGYKVSAGQGLTYQVQGSPGNGKVHFKVDIDTFASCTVADWTQRGHAQIVFSDALDKEQRIRVSSFASIALSIAHGLTKKDTGQIITGGTLVSVYDNGDVSTGTLTLDYGLRPMQSYNNMGAHTLAPDTQTGYITLIVKNSTGAGAITTTGWSLVDGDAFDTSVGYFICYAHTTEHPSGTNKSHLNVKQV